MSVPDLLRIACASVSLLLMAACIYAIFRSRDGDQRLRFGSTALIALVVVAGQLDNLGSPGNWRMPVLLLALVLFTVGAARFLVKDRRRADL